MENLQRTLVLIKPDGVQRGLIGEIIKRFETHTCRKKVLRWANQIYYICPHYCNGVGRQQCG